MKLILSSCDFRNDKSSKCIIDNLGIPIGQCRVLFFPNEKATEAAIKSNLYYDRLQEFGFARENIYVFNYYKPESFTDLKIDAVYISGGNTFATLDRIIKSGFSDRIVQFVKNGSVYIGGSAGAHIASANIEHVMKYDHNTPNLTDFAGLSLLNGILICHYTESRECDFALLKSDNKYKVYALTDSDSLLVTDNGVIQL